MSERARARHARLHRGGRRRHPPTPGLTIGAYPASEAPRYPRPMVERIRRAGTVCWAVCGVAAVVALLGLIAYVFRVIWPPLILAGAIVFLLNPVVTRLQARHIPPRSAPRCPTSRWSATVVLVVLLVAPLATRQYDDLAEEWPELREDLEDDVNDLAERSEENEWPIRIPTWEELEDQFSGGGRRPTPTATASSARRRSRTASPPRSRPPASSALQVFHVGIIFLIGPIIAFYLLVDLPHIRRVFRVAGAGAGPWRLDGAHPSAEHRDRRLLPRPARRGVRRRDHGVDRHADHRPAVLADRRHDRRASST